MKAVLVREPGGPEVLTLGEAPDPLPGPNELLVSIKAAGVNRAEVLQRQGKYPPPAGASDILGLELAGDVIATGPGTTKFKVGDKVMGLVTGGAYAERGKVPEATALPIPNGLTYEQAAAIPEAFVTAWLNLFDLGLLEPKETVLIHAGASGVGAAAIQLAREAGAQVLTTVGTQAKKDFVLRLGAAKAILRQDEDVTKAVLLATQGEGAHLVLDVVGAPAWKDNMQSLRRGGRLVLIGFLGGSKGELELGYILRKNLHVTGTTLRGSPLSKKSEWMQEFDQFARKRFEDGRLTVPLDKTFPLAQAAEAHRYMEDDRNLGKIVLVM
jgi:putative PIG3 family NAD(P)H quinone oxidoreductase